MQYLLSHRTTYSYASSVDSAHHIAHLRARAFPGQKVTDISIVTQPLPALAVQLFAGEEKAWRHEGLALGVLREIATDGQERLEELSEAITRAYFSHVPAAQAVGSMASLAAE